MGNLYLNKFRIDSARAPWWNYRDAAAYFITICTYRRIHFFGNISNDKLVPSPIGRIVEDEWLKSFQIREDMNLKSGKYVVMPNHFHAIITIGQNRFNSQNCNFQNGGGGNNGGHGGGRDAMHCVSTENCHPAENRHPAENKIVAPANLDHPTQNRFGPQSKNLGAIVRGFKSAVTVRARQLNPNFAWQPRFHDHIIRNPGEFDRISIYILNNPRKWPRDRFHRPVP